MAFRIEMGQCSWCWAVKNRGGGTHISSTSEAKSFALLEEKGLAGHCAAFVAKKLGSHGRRYPTKIDS